MHRCSRLRSLLCRASTVLVLAIIVCPSGIAQEPQAYHPGAGVSAPKLIKQVKPNYTPEAKAARIQGTVLIEAVIREDGAVGDVRIVRSLDAKYGLDNEAVKAAKQWTFSPGQKDGKPVPVLVTIELAFTLPK
jgi:protein TonB